MTTLADINTGSCFFNISITAGYTGNHCISQVYVIFSICRTVIFLDFCDQSYQAINSLNFCIFSRSNRTYLCTICCNGFNCGSGINSKRSGILNRWCCCCWLRAISGVPYSVCSICRSNGYFLRLIEHCACGRRNRRSCYSTFFKGKCNFYCLNFSISTSRTYCNYNFFTVSSP